MEIDSKAVESFPYFMENVFSEYYIHKYGKWVSGDFINSVAFLMQQKDILVLSLPRAHGKTTLSMGYLAWMVYKLKEKEESYISYGGNNIFNHNEIIEMLRHLGFEVVGFLGEEIFDEATGKTKRGPTYIICSNEAGAIRIDFGRAINRRYDLILDDDTENYSLKDSVQKKRWENSQVIILGSEFSIKGEDREMMLKFPALNGKEQPIWPEMWSRDRLFKTKQMCGRDSFYREFM